MAEDAPIEVEPSAGTKLAHDVRPHMPLPPPVRLIAVADVHLPAAAGREAELDAFYLDVLKFLREPGGPLSYRADNYALVFDVLEPPITRDALPATMIEVPSLTVLRDALIAVEIEFEFVRGLTPGHQHLALHDPTGNWLNIGEWHIVR